MCHFYNILYNWWLKNDHFWKTNIFKINRRCLWCSHVPRLTLRSILYTVYVILRPLRPFIHKYIYIYNLNVVSVFSHRWPSPHLQPLLHVHLKFCSTRFYLSLFSYKFQVDLWENTTLQSASAPVSDCDRGFFFLLQRPSESDSDWWIFMYSR